MHGGEVLYSLKLKNEQRHEGKTDIALYGYFQIEVYFWYRLGFEKNAN